MSKFVIHFHDAIRRGKHYDLRFQIPNSKNWASFVFNEFPSDEPGKRIYVPRSNDHSTEEALMVGKIPEGQYGAGILTVADKGECEILKYTNAHIVINFHGKKLKGIYHFVNTGVFGKKRNYSKKIYSFFKAKI